MKEVSHSLYDPKMPTYNNGLGREKMYLTEFPTKKDLNQVS